MSAENAVNAISEPLLKFEKFSRGACPPPPSFCACARTPSNPHATPLKQVVSSFPSFRPPGKQAYIFFFIILKMNFFEFVSGRFFFPPKKKS